MLFTVGDKFREKFHVSHAVYEGFISIFKDKNQLHTDESFATGHGFKKRVMYGNILNGFLSFFIGECLPDKKVIIHSQEIQYKNPVYLNDELTLAAEVTGISESVGVVEFKFNFKNSDALVVAKGKIQIGLLK